jgi:hypothetical protein
LLAEIKAIQKMKAKPNYKRIAKPIKGAEVAAQPRLHAIPEASEDTCRQNPQRQDLLRRHTLSNRRDTSDE